jgi:hypothetical protein
MDAPHLSALTDRTNRVYSHCNIIVRRCGIVHTRMETIDRRLNTIHYYVQHSMRRPLSTAFRSRQIIAPYPDAKASRNGRLKEKKQGQSQLACVALIRTRK